MGNFELGVEKLFKGKSVAANKYKKIVKQAGKKLSDAAKLRKSAQ